VSGPLAVFLDRDGVVNELVPSPATGVAESPLSPEVVRLVGGVGESLAILRAAGYRLACVTNQPAAAKGVVPIDQLLSVQARVVELLEEAGARFDAVRMCLHHPEGVISDLTRPCGCRKPQPGLLLSAAAELGIELSGSWMIGDTDSDIAAGHAAGCRTVLVETPGSLHKRAGAASIERAADLAGAVSIVVRTRKND
jgi:D-glycero-D-manno-heptose 1,7-bisphosphate phosphatase